MKAKGYIPDFLTLSNLLCGVLAMVQVANDNLAGAAWFILAGAGFDFFDGLVARALGVSGEMGKQLDSLADVVTFGAAPALIGLHLTGALRNPGLGWPEIFGYTPLLIAAAAAYRLAKFNLDTRQTTGFIGMPTPANALYWVALALMATSTSTATSGCDLFSDYLLHFYAVIAASVLLSTLMVSEWKLISLKFSGPGYRQNKSRYALLISGAILLILLRAEAVPIILLLYLAISTIEHRLTYGIQSRN